MLIMEPYVSSANKHYCVFVCCTSAAAVVAVVDGDGVVVLVVAVVVVCCMKVVAVVLVVVVAEYSVVVLVVVAVVLAVVVAYAVGGNMPSSNCFWSGGNWGRCYDPIAFNWMGIGTWLTLLFGRICRWCHLQSFHDGVYMRKHHSFHVPLHCVFKFLSSYINIVNDACLGILNCILKCLRHLTDFVP